MKARQMHSLSEVETDLDRTEVLRLFCSMAREFEQRTAHFGFMEIAHLLSVARYSAEESLREAGHLTVRNH